MSFTITALIVDDEPNICKTLSRVIHSLSPYPVKILEAENGKVALQLMENQAVDMVITDVKMPVMDGLTLLKKIRIKNKEIPVIVTSAHGDESIILEALRGGATTFFRKPSSLSVIEDTLRSIFGFIHEQKALRINYENLDYLCCEMHLQSDITLMASTSQCLLQYFYNSHYISQVVSIQTVFYELLANAIEHGNWEINGEEKRLAQTEGNWDKLVKERTQNPQYLERQVHIRLEYTPMEATFTITDEGNGFDWRQIPDAFSEDAILWENGRGLILSKIYCKSLSYNDKGNEVTFVIAAQKD
ncbi:MAG: response regulator [SAR324 cluster bacterium]|nr:response regulator [SAR324 cluster bacterium]